MNKLRSYLKNKRLIIGFYLAPAIAAFSIALVMMPGIRPQAIDSIANSAADVVVGQPDMNSNYINQVGYGKTLYSPGSAVVAGTKLIVADGGNHRVLIYNSVPTVNNAAADVVIGQPDMISNSRNQGGSPSSKTLSAPRFVSTDGVRLAVADTANHRILIYNSIPASNNVAADVVVGQPDFASVSINQGGGASARTIYWPYAVLIANSKLLVADSFNHRVLIYNTVPTSNNAAADVVIGQPDFESVQKNRNGGATPAQNSLSGPTGLSFDGTKLFILDHYNNRLLIFNSMPTALNANADVVVGQSNFTSFGGYCTATRYYQPYDVICAGGKLLVSDTYNNRVLVYNSVPTTNGAAADVAIGQADLVSNSSGISDHQLNNSYGIYSDGTKLFIPDAGNRRVLVYNSIPAASGASADLVIGQPDFTHNQENQADICAANTMYSPISMCYDDEKLFVSEHQNHRILIYNSFPTSSNQSANIVIGQPDMTSNNGRRNSAVVPNGLYKPVGVCRVEDKLFVADQMNHRVLIYNSIPTSNFASADAVLGQPDLQSGTANNDGGVTARSLYQPTYICSDGTRLFVVDQNNNRVLIYNSIPTSAFAPADIVLGQPDMNSNAINEGGATPTARSMYKPTYLWVSGGKLFVADSLNNRLLIYNSIPTVSNTPADVVIGQPDMTHNLVNQGGSCGANTISMHGFPYSDGSRLFVADWGNHRVLVFDKIPETNNASASMVIGQPDMTSNSANQGGAVGSNTLNNPSSAILSGGNLFIADYGNNRVLMYNISNPSPSISNVKFNDVLFVSGDIVSPSPVIKATLAEPGGVGIYINNLKITVDTTLYTYASFDASTDSYNSTTGIFTFKIKSALSTGTHNVKIEVSDYLGNWGTYEATNLTVKDQAGEVQIEGTPLNYPNPFSTATGATKITYSLTVDSSIMVYIFDVRGALVWKRSYALGSMGGKAGYNEITWDGKDDFASTVGNGIYPYRIVSGGRVLGRGKIAVLD